MVAVLGVAVLAAAAAVLLSNPRHRAFYFGRPAPTREQRATLAAPPSIRRSAVGSSGRGAGATLPSGLAAASGKRIPVPDAGGRIRVPVADDRPWQLPVDGVPSGWDLHEFAGQASVELIRSDGRLAMRLRSERSSFALSRDVVLNPREFPYLTWSWRVMKLPANGDVRDPARDDQAAQVYVVFPRWPSPRTASDVVGYVWDTRAPVGTRHVSSRSANVRVFVVESGPGRLGAWHVQQRNVVEDYVALFGREPPRIGKVAVMIDTNDTRGGAEALMGDLFFSKAPLTRTELPTAALR